MAAHGALFAALLASLPRDRPPPVQTFEVQIVSPPERLRPDIPEAPVEPVEQRADPAPPQPSFAVRPAPVRATPQSPGFTAPAPRPAPPAPTLGTGAPRAVQPATEQVREGLRLSVGCDSADVLGLTRRERERCAEERGARTRDAALPEGYDREREDARAVARNPRRPATSLVRAPREGPQNHPVVGLPPVTVGASIPFGKPPKAIEPIAPSTLRGDDDALRPRPAAKPD